MPYNAGSAIQRVTLANAATDVDYTITAGTAADPNVVVGNVASGAADSGAPVKAGAKYNVANPTFTDGQRGDLQITAGGALKVFLSQATGSGINTIQGNADAIAGTGTGYQSASFGYRFNGATWDRNRKPNLTARIASSAASGNPAVLKASAGDLTMFWGQNGAAITYLQIYNKASAPTIGTDTPVMTYPIPANAFFSMTIPNGGYYFATGIAYAFTTDAAATTGAGAAAVTACNIIGA